MNPPCFQCLLISPLRQRIKGAENGLLSAAFGFRRVGHSKAEIRKAVSHMFRQFGLDGEVSAFRVRESQAAGVQMELWGETFGESGAIGGIADDGGAERQAMNPQLVHAAGLGGEFGEGEFFAGIVEDFIFGDGLVGIRVAAVGGFGA
jgi:hypothetical protein